MSWSSRFGNLGRFSPFGRNNSPSKPQVTDSDFSYITSEDLARHAAENSATHGNTRSAEDGDRDDTLILKHQKVSYPLHFPAGSLSAGEVTVGVLRIDAAKKLGVTDARRIQLVYRGKKLKDDRALACDEGLRSGQESSILCVVSESHGPDGFLEPHPSDDNVISGASDEDYSDDAGTQSPLRTKKKKKRGSRKKKGTRSPTPSTPPASNLQVPRSEYIGATRPVSAPPEHTAKPSRPEPPTVQKFLDDINRLRDDFGRDWLPLIDDFIRSPPSEDKVKAEHGKIGLSVEKRILSQLDLVQPSDDFRREDKDAVRTARKAAVKEVDEALKRLDKAKERVQRPLRE